MLRDLILDVRFALRSLRRSPAFAATALLTIALSIGATTAVFSIVNGVLLRPLPYPEPDRLVRLYEVNKGAGIERSPLSFPDIVDWRTHGSAFESIAFAVVALLACYIPAARAARINPADALKGD